MVDKNEKDKSGIPIPIKHKYCNSNLYKIWKWEGIIIYQCGYCKEILLEGEVE